MHFAMENPNTETAYNCRLFPYFNFKWQKAKKHVFCNGGYDYGNNFRI